MAGAKKKYISDGSEAGEMLARIQNVGIVEKEHMTVHARARDASGWCAVHAAAINGRTALLRALVAAGADAFAKTPSGSDALGIATARKHTAAVKALTALRAERQEAMRAKRAAAKAAVAGGSTLANPSPERKKAQARLYAMVKYPKLSRPSAARATKFFGTLSPPFQMAADNLREEGRDRMGAAVALNHRTIEGVDRARKQDGYVPPEPKERQF